MSSNNPGGTAGPGVNPLFVPEKPTVGAVIGKVATDTLKLLLGTVQTPEGLQLAIGLLGAANPAIGLLVQFGSRAIAAALADITAAEVSDADIETALAAKGKKVDPFDPTTLFSG